MSGEQQGTDHKLSAVLVFSVIVVLVVVALYKLLTTASPEVGAACILGSATVFGAVTTVVLDSRSERDRVIGQEHRAQKIPVYEEFMEVWFRIIQGDKPGIKPVTPDEMGAFFTKFPQKLIVWAPEAVIHEYSIPAVQHPQHGGEPPP